MFLPKFQGDRVISELSILNMNDEEEKKKNSKRAETGARLLSALSVRLSRPLCEVSVTLNWIIVCVNGGGCKIKGLAASCCGPLLTERAAVEMIRNIAPGGWCVKRITMQQLKRENNTGGKVYWPPERDAAAPAVCVSQWSNAGC